MWSDLLFLPLRRVGFAGIEIIGGKREEILLMDAIVSMVLGLESSTYLRPIELFVLAI